MDGKFVTYYRVSTKHQGKSGLGLEAQKVAVEAFLNGGSWTLLESFQEIESGANNDRPELAKALAMCRMTGAELLIAKLDRLSRDAHFLLGLEKSGVEFKAVDMPFANRLTVGVMALVAEEERKAASARTKAALAAAKARGVQLGGWKGGPKVDSSLGRDAQKFKANTFAADVGPMVATLQNEGLKLRAIAEALTSRGVRTPRGKSWTAHGVRQVLLRHSIPA